MTARIADGIAVPLRPMIGVIGVAPAGAPVATASPGAHGGNMDTRLIGEGAVLYLPVAHEGALLAAGDLHAAMGDGEICGTGVEDCGSVTLRLDVRRDLRSRSPVLETPELVATIASAETLDAAAEAATRDMARLLTERLGISLEVATMLMSAGGDLQVSQVVDPLRTARFALPKGVVAGLGDELSSEGRRPTARHRGGGTRWLTDTAHRAWSGRLRRVMMRRPGEAMAAADPATGTTPGPSTSRRRAAHTTRSPTRCAPGTSRCSTTSEPLPDHSDSVFVFDPALVTDRGTLVLSMGKEQRRGEEEPLARALQDCGVPVYGRLEGGARAEGGDTLWLDHDTLAVGRGFRTNAEGVRQLRGLLEPLGVDGPRLRPALLHRPRRVPAPAQRDQPGGRRPGRGVPAADAHRVLGELRRRGVRLLEVPEEEFGRTQATNVLTVSPRRCIMLDGSPVTKGAARDGGLRGRHLPRRAALASRPRAARPV